MTYGPPVYDDGMQNIKGFFSSFASVRMQAPFFLLVFEAVVSKDIPTNFSANPHSSNAKTTAFA